MSKKMWARWEIAWPYQTQSQAVFGPSQPPTVNETISGGNRAPRSIIIYGYLLITLRSNNGYNP